MSSDKIGMTQGSHDVQLTMAGEVESVRGQLAEALERVGYKVLDEQPLTARRGAHGWACAGGSFDALDYPTTLTISLKQLNAVAVVATFNFEIKHSTYMTGGDRQTLEREAEAIAALAAQRVAFAACPACGTQAGDDSRFCRRCGAPMVSDVAELEVFRLTRGSRAALQSLAMSVILLLFGALLSLFYIWVRSPKGIKGLTMVVTLFIAFGFLVLMQSIRRLHYTLNPRERDGKQAPTPRPRLAAVSGPLLPPHQRPASVTEGTTELLAPTLSLNEPIAVPINRQSRDTGPVN